MCLVCFGRRCIAHSRGRRRRLVCTDYCGKIFLLSLLKCPDHTTSHNLHLQLLAYFSKSRWCSKVQGASGHLHGSDSKLTSCIRYVFSSLTEGQYLKKGTKRVRGGSISKTNCQIEKQLFLKTFCS